MKKFYTLEEAEELFDKTLGLNIAQYLFTGINERMLAAPFNKEKVNFLNTLNVSDNELANEWQYNYDEFYFYTPISDEEATDSTKLYKILAKATWKINKVLHDNMPKYCSMLYTIGVDYNPISNYDMVEKESGSYQEGKHSSDSTTGIDPNNNGGKHEFEATRYEYPYDYSGTTPDNNKIKSQDISSEKGGTKTTSNYWYDSTDGKVTANFKVDSTDDSGLKGNSVNDRWLTRSGNIGVTTTQQMLESEIELKRLKVIDEFFRDINKVLLLSTL